MESLCEIRFKRGSRNGTKNKGGRKQMKFEIEVSGDQWREMCKNRYGQGNVITRSGMLDILNDIVDQIHEQS